MNDESRDVRHRFPSTRWSEVARVGQASGDRRKDGLAALLPRYLPALRAHLLYDRRLSPDLCEDVLQAFVAEKILTRNLISEARQERGKFRTFLLVTLDRFMLNFLRSEYARGRKIQEYEAIDNISSSQSSAPSILFDIAWARGVLAETVDLMEKECVEKGRLDLWGVFKARTLSPILDHAEPVPYRDLVQQYNYVSPSQATNALVTANRMFVRILHGVVGAYAQSEDAIDDEIRHLHKILSSAGARTRGSGV